VISIETLLSGESWFSSLLFIQGSTLKSIKPLFDAFFYAIKFGYMEYNPYIYNNNP
jgi:hypothetical protein